MSSSESNESESESYEENQNDSDSSDGFYRFSRGEILSKRDVEVKKT